MYKPLPTQIGTSFEADFEKNTWTFEMQDNFTVAAGGFVIMDTAVYRDLIVAANDVLANQPPGELPEALVDALNRLNQLVEAENNVPF